jgi:hypothetical protein
MRPHGRSYITYLREFGPEAYFVHFPTKFLAAQATGAVYNQFLSYSADFASGYDAPVPPGAGYHWTLQQSRMTLSPTFTERLAQQRQAEAVEST